MDIPHVDVRWNSLYTLAGAAAVLALLSALLDVSLSFTGVPVQYGVMSAAGWFEMLNGNMLLGLRNLGLLNILNMVLMIPVVLALYAIHRETNRPYAALALMFFVIGAAVYGSNNVAVPMGVLSARYAAAATDAQRSLLAAAGESLLAQGEDFTPGPFFGFILTEMALIGMLLVMLRGGVFSKPTVVVGLAGFAFLTFFTIWSTFIPAAYNVVMLVFGAGGGLLTVVWYILIARRLFQLGAA